jgi:hypothetical protein
MNAFSKYHQVELKMKADYLGIALEGIKKREDGQFINMVFLIGLISSQ